MNKKFSKPGYEQKKSTVVSQKKRHLKTAVIVVLAVFVILGVICLVLSAIENALKKE